MKLTLEQRLKRTGIGLIAATGIMLGADLLPLPYQGQYLNAQTTQTEQTQEGKIKLKKLRENRAEREGKKQEAESRNIVNQYSLRPVNFDVLDSQGNVIDVYRNITYEQAKSLVVPIPEGGKIVLVNPQSLDGYVVDMMTYDLNDKKLSDKTGNDVFRHILDTNALGLKEGSAGTLTFNLEPYKVIASMRIGYQILPKIPESPEEQIKLLEQLKTLLKPEEQTPEQPQPTLQPPVEEESKESFVEPKREGEKPLSFTSIRGAYVLQSENAAVESDDPERTSKGALVELVNGGKKHQVFCTATVLTYDEAIALYGTTQLRNTFSEVNVGGEFKVAGPIIIGAEYIHSDNQWVPTIMPSFTPPMNKHTYDGFFGGAGLVLGEFNDSFIEGLIYWGKGNVKQKINIPGRYYYDDLTIDSQSLTELFYKIHGRIRAGRLLLEGTASWGKYDDANKTLEGTRETIGGKIGVGLSKNIFIGGFFHHAKIKDNNVELPHDMYGPILMINF